MSTPFDTYATVFGVLGAAYLVMAVLTWQTVTRQERQTASIIEGARESSAEQPHRTGPSSQPGQWRLNLYISGAVFFLGMCVVCVRI